MRTMYDAVVAANCPGDGQLYAGYLDGRWPNFAEMQQRFPNAVHVAIVISAANNDGHVLDVETGDAAPSQAPAWVQHRRFSGIDPTVYCNASTWPAVRAAFQAQGVPEPHYWIAQYDNNMAIPAGAVAKQYATGDYDRSSVADVWPGIDLAPQPSEDETWAFA